MEINIAIIIVHFGKIEVTERCLQSIYENKCNSKIFISDNSQNFLSTRQDIVIINNPENKGYAGAVNVGIKKAIEFGFSEFIIMNNDVVLKSDSISNLLLNLPNDKKVIASPRILYFNDKSKIWYNGGVVDLFQLEGKHKNIDKEINRVKVNDISKVSFVSGCFLYFSKETFEIIGGFDEDFFLYYEDLDFSIKAIRKGIDLYLIPQSEIFHNVSSSTKSGNKILKFSNNIYYYRIRNKIIIIKHYGKGFFLFTSSLLLILKIFKYFLGFIILGDFVKLTQLYKSIKDGLFYKQK